MSKANRHSCRKLYLRDKCLCLAASEVLQGIELQRPIDDPGTMSFHRLDWSKDLGNVLPCGSLKGTQDARR